METFEFHNPTKLFFGENVIDQLSIQIPTFGTRILLVYGGGSIKRNGIYDKVMHQLNELNCEVHELSGVEPNPRLTTVQQGIELCKQHEIELILAVGGGSVIDCVKAIAAGAKYEGDVWDVITGKATPKQATPFGTVLTLAATGSEMNRGSVITKWETKEKIGWGNPLVYPKFSLLDPQHTFTVPLDQTIYGIVDIMSHVLEQYFHNNKHTYLQDGFCETILRTVIDIGSKLVNDLHNYDHRAVILYCGTMAFNGMITMGVSGDWATHQIEHAVSAVYDIPHGGGLAILFPNWMSHVLDDHNSSRFKRLAINVFNVDPAGKTDRGIAEEGIQTLRDFWTSIGAPHRLADYGIGDEHLELMTDRAMADGAFGNYKLLQREDVKAIYEMSL